MVRDLGRARQAVQAPTPACYRPTAVATRRQEQKARTRARILEAARARFEADGFEGTTIATVAAAAGVATGTVMAHFPDKPALVAAAFHDAIAEVVDAATGSAPEQPAIERLLHVAEALYRFYAARPELSRALVREATFPEGGPNEALTAQLQRFLGWVGETLAQGAARGELRAGVDSGLGAMGFWADYFLVLLMVLHAPDALETHLGQLEALLRLRYT